MPKLAPSVRSLSLDIEAAYEVVNQMIDPVREDPQGLTHYSGNHPKYGNIHVVIPAMGDSLLLLPFEAHDA